MGLKKLKKKLKKSTKKATDAVTDSAKDVGEEISHAANQTAKFAGKTFNQATGAIEEALDEAVDYARDDLNKAARYAEKQLKTGVDWVEDLAQEAIDAAYRAIYKKYVADYIQFIAALGEAQGQILRKESNILTEIRDNLLAGRFTKSVDDVMELLDSDVMQKPLDAGHELFGTTFVVAADLSFGVSGQGVTGSASGSVGIAQMTDHFDDYRYESCIFTAAGGAVGITNSTGPGAELGISWGFLAKDPTNISGWFVDVSGSGNLDNGVFGLGLSWAPPGKKPPYVKAEPVLGVGRIGLSSSKDASGALTIGPSYTWIIQKVKNELYRG